MRREKMRRQVWGVLAAVGVGLATNGVRADYIIADGWDLLHTPPGGAAFGGVPFVGVPLGTYDFGGGPVGIGNTDTIVRRHADAVLGGPPPGTAPPIPIEIVALQLRSAVPVDFGLGLGLYYVTLQSDHGGPASVGQMSVMFLNEPALPTDPHGQFSSFFDVFFDIRLGAPNGPIAISDNLLLSNSAATWSHESAEPGVLKIPGVNFLLNGLDPDQDFFPYNLIEQHPGGAFHAPVPSTPEASQVIPAIAVTALCVGRWQRQRAGSPRS